MPTRSLRRPGRIMAGLVATGLVATVVVALPPMTYALFEPGTPGDDVHLGFDNDNADNPLIQPPGVSAPQHMSNADVMFGRDGKDLLMGRRGADTLVGGTGSDILAGGPDTPGAPEPENDVVIAETGNDVMIWAPGDGNDALIGDTEVDSVLLGPFVANTQGNPLLVRYDGRRIPKLAMDDHPEFSCEVVPVPVTEETGTQFLVRFRIDAILTGIGPYWVV